MPRLTRGGYKFLEYFAWIVIAAGIIIIFRAIFKIAY